MKVIGETSSGYLIEATEREIINIFGFSSEYDSGWKEFRGSRNDTSIIGLEIHPSAAYQKLAWLLKRNKEFDVLCKKLRETADAIDQHKPLFTKIVGEDDV